MENSVEFHITDSQTRPSFESPWIAIVYTTHLNGKGKLWLQVAKSESQHLIFPCKKAYGNPHLAISLVISLW